MASAATSRRTSSRTATRKKPSYTIIIDSDSDTVGAQQDVEEDVFTPNSPQESADELPAPAPRRNKVLKRVGSQSASTLTVSTVHPASLHGIHNIKTLQKELLDWYERAKNLRTMPWRKDYDASLSPDERAQRAYEVLVSEIMLQQTQCATVVPYFNKWLATFPTIRALAEADIETVNSNWKGLGYYRRASMLLKAAQKVVKDFDSRIPSDVIVLEKEVPGVGRYTAGAVTSIAYNISAPAVDGNVQRVLTRVLALHAPLTSKAALNIIWGAASALVESDVVKVPGAWNQALIELGSTVCKPQNPACSKCPLTEGCAAYQISKTTNLPPPPTESTMTDIEDLCGICESFPSPSSLAVTDFPVKIQKKKAREEASAMCVIDWMDTQGERWFLLVRRPDNGLLAGLWEFPTLDFAPDVIPQKSDLFSAPSKLLADILETQPTPYVPRTPAAAKSSLTLKPGDPFEISQIRDCGSVLHIFSHIRKTYHALWVKLGGGGDGDEPPKIRISSRKAGTSTNTVKLAKKRKANAIDKHDLRETPQPPVQAKWVKELDVMNANLGTGTTKVWKQVQAALKSPFRST